MRTYALALAALLLCALVVPAGCRRERVSPAAGGASGDCRVLSIWDAVPRGKVVLDGQLDDWPGLEGHYIDQQLDHHSRTPIPGRNDCALLGMMVDDQALYFALRVLDAAVHNPYELKELGKGDTVGLYLDVRPTSGDGPLLGDPYYSDGVYALSMAPPDPAGRSTRWQAVEKRGLRPLGKVEVAGRLRKGGYVLEARLPFASLGGVTRARFNSPIGFEVSINDVDAPRKTKAQRKLKTYYSWGGGRGCSRDPSRFSRAARGRAIARKPFMRLIAPRILTVGKQRVLKAAVVTLRGNQAAGAKLKLSARFESETWAAALKPPERVPPEGKKPPEIPAKASFSPVADLEVQPRPELGLEVHVRSIKLSELALGRYYFRASCPGSGIPAATTRMYHWRNSRGQLDSYVLRGSESDADLAEALSWMWMRIGTESCYSLGATELKGSLKYISPHAHARWLLSEAVRDGRRFPELLLRLRRPDGNWLPWKTSLSADARHHEFTVPLAGLTAGRYQLEVSVQSLRGKVRAVRWTDWNGPVPARAPLTVCPDYGHLLATSCRDSAEMLTRMVKLGDPYRKQFPKDDGPDSFARSIWDMQLHDGRIYFGCGDWNLNRGPIDVLSFAPPGEKRQLEFRKEVTVDEESVDVIREYGGQLFVPGIDSRESWKLGNLYVRTAGKWKKLRTVPGGIHVLDAALFKGKLYATAGTLTGAALYQSEDQGKSWKRYDLQVAGEPGEGRYYEILPLKDCLLVTGSRTQERAYTFANGKMKPLRVPLLPGHTVPASFAVLKRMQRFGAGAVYTLWSVVDPKRPAPLFYLKDLEEGAQIVENFRDKQVRDVLVRGTTCYVLTGSSLKKGFVGEVYRSTDLIKWKRIANFSPPALPVSMELSGKTFFVGLGGRARDKNEGESGTIWTLQPAAQ
jgi:Carbohydrate family 9 binding domain-like